MLNQAVAVVANPGGLLLIVGVLVGGSVAVVVAIICSIVVPIWRDERSRPRTGGIAMLLDSDRALDDRLRDLDRLHADGTISREGARDLRRRMSDPTREQRTTER